METKRCPFCAEEIRAEAIRCRFCRSRLTGFAMETWHRSHREARWLGVCAALAHAVAVPVTAVRIGFVLLTVVIPIHVLVPAVYLALWLIIPREPGGDSLLEHGLRRALALAARLSGRPEPPAGSSSLMQS